WRFGVPIAGLAGVALTYFAFNNQSLLPAVYLPFVGALVGMAGLLVWRRRDISRLMTKWGKVRERLVAYLRPESVSDPANRAKWAMIAVMMLFAGLALWTIPQVAWIGHADYAENANVARSLIEGHGLTVDYSAQFYQARPELSHPAETWPLLQPLVIAPFFAILGAQTWVAKLPNLFILLALAWGVFAVGSRLWDARVGLIGGIFTLLHSYFFNSVLYPINDLAFTAIFFALAWMVWRWIAEQQEENASQGKPRIVHYVLIGVLAGLLVWSKPSGTILIVGLGIWVLWGWWQRKRLARKQVDKGREGQVPWRGLVITGGAFGVVLAPLVVRNLLAFHSPFYSTEGYDAWILRYYPFYEWENIYKYYIGSELPHIRWIVGGKFGYANLFDAIGLNFQWVWTKGVMGGVASSEFVIGPFALLGAVVGGIVAPRRALRAAGMALFAIALYGIFVLLYWHFEGRYFQVAIPWLYLLLAGAVVAAGDMLGKLVRGVGGQVAGIMLVAGLTVAFVWAHVYSIGNFLVYDTRPTSFTVAMDWLSANSTPDDVVMTRDPWELNWYTQRRAVMIPFDDYATIEKVARESGVTMLQLGGPTDGLDVATCPDSGDGSRFPTGSRPALGKLYCGFEMPGYTLVYKNGDLTIYRVDR
ncbi:MAG: glycosyltransferase family 39 protein, partial [Chloroflexia bacterium]